MPEPRTSQTIKRLALTFLLVCIFTADSFFIQIYVNGVHLSICRNRCRCIDENRSVNCTDRAFRDIPDDIPPFTFDLNFNWNFVETLSSLSFASTPLLQNLFIAHNRLQIIENGTFHGLWNLTRLFLEDNFLTEVPSALTALGNLTYLDLSKNRLTQIDGSRLSPSLRELYLIENAITVLDSRSFFGLENIQAIFLSKNQIHTIKEKPLLWTPNLQGLNIVHNSIKTLPEGWLGSATQLEALYLTGNKITWTTDVRDWFVTKTPLQLEILFLNKNRISSLPASAFRGIPNMATLSLGSNLLQNLEGSCFDELTNLEILLISDNRLKGVPAKLFANNIRLKRLILRANKLQHLPPNLLKNNINLDFLDLAGNRIRSLPRGLLSDEIYPNLTTLDLRNNLFKRVPLLDNFPSLSVLVMSNNKITKLSQTAFINNPYLVELKLDDNLLQTLSKQTFMHLEYLTVVSVLGNSFMCDCKLTWLIKESSEWAYNARTTLACKYPYAIELDSLNDFYFNDEYQYDDPGMIDTSKDLNDLCRGPKEKSKYLMISCIWILVIVLLLVVYWSRKIINAQKRLNAGKPKIRRRYSLIPNKVPSLQNPPWRSIRRHSRKRNGKYTSLSKTSSPPRITVSCLPHSGMVYKQRETTV